MRKTLASLFAAIAIVIAAGAPAGAATETWAIYKDHSTVSFQVRHLLTKVRGQFETFRGTVLLDPQHPEQGSVEFTIDAGSIDTDNAKRDEHLRAPDFFDVAAHPQITFKSRKVVALAPNRFAVAGTLTLHGVAREVTLPVELAGTSKDPWGNVRAGFSTSLTLDRKDYGITWNRTLDNGGTLLSDDVDIVLTIEADQAK